MEWSWHHFHRFMLHSNSCYTMFFSAYAVATKLLLRISIRKQWEFVIIKKQWEFVIIRKQWEFVKIEIIFTVVPSLVGGGSA